MRTSFRSVSPPIDMLATADGIGERLVLDAVWYRDRCNWVGVEPGAQAHRALGPDLGGGTAGIALFLAQLHAATSNEAVRHTALGAIDQALAYVDQAPGDGLYAGRLGIAYAAARCGLLLGDERLLRRSARLCRGRWAREPGAFDVMSGTAGVIVALLALARLHDDERLLQRARPLGDALSQGARRGPEGWSWPVPGDRRAHSLCGIAHGAAGAAWALLELFAATGERCHREAAERALDYERHWFDAQERNWPDLRGIERRERRGSFRPPFAITWCHGAPGIALSRLRAWEILGDDRYRAEALIALRTTAMHVERALITTDPDFTLGLGLAGNADVLALGAKLSADGTALADRVGEVGTGRYAAGVDGWPCGAPGGRAPALLTGRAGIGMFYLRLHDGSVPSALAP